MGCFDHQPYTREGVWILSEETNNQTSDLWLKKNMCLNCPVVLLRVVIPKNHERNKHSKMSTAHSRWDSWVRPRVVGRTRQVAERAAQVGSVGRRR